MQINYTDWLKIEKLLKLNPTKTKKINLSRYAGTIKLTEDPINFQRRLRDEWQ